MPRTGLFYLTVPALVLSLGQRALAQAQPTATAPLFTNGVNLGLLNGSFHYAVNVGEVFQTGYVQNQDVTYQTNVSGSLAYATRSEVHPSTIVYAGGVQVSNQSYYGTTVFQSLSLSQGYNTRNWTFNLADTVSYLPQSPTVGLSGIPGAGQIGLYPVTGIESPAQDVLTYNSNRITNTVTGSVARRLTARTSISGDASYGLLHFFNNAAFDTRQENADVNLNHTLDARSSFAVGVTYSLYTYSTNSNLTGTQNAAVSNASFQTKGVLGRYQRQLTRALTFNVSAGPQWISSSQSLGIPSRLTTQASAGLTYVRRVGTFGAFYTRGANGGSGVVPGAISDSLTGSFSRSFGRDWSTGLNAGYSRTTGLASGSPNVQNFAALGIPNYGNFNSTFGGAQVNRRLSHSFFAYASYTAFNQSYDNYVQTQVIPGSLGTLGGLVQSFAIGLSFSPRPFNLGQF